MCHRCFNVQVAQVHVGKIVRKVVFSFHRVFQHPDMSVVAPVLQACLLHPCSVGVIATLFSNIGWLSTQYCAGYIAFFALPRRCFVKAKTLPEKMEAELTKQYGKTRLNIEEPDLKALAEAVNALSTSVRLSLIHI